MFLMCSCCIILMSDDYGTLVYFVILLLMAVCELLGDPLSTSCCFKGHLSFDVVKSVFGHMAVVVVESRGLSLRRFPQKL